MANKFGFDLKYQSRITIQICNSTTISVVRWHSQQVLLSMHLISMRTRSWVKQQTMKFVRLLVWTDISVDDGLLLSQFSVFDCHLQSSSHLRRWFAHNSNVTLMMGNVALMEPHTDVGTWNTGNNTKYLRLDTKKWSFVAEYQIKMKRKCCFFYE